MLLNIQGVKTSAKYATFENYILGLVNKPHVIVLCEHWLEDNEVKGFSIKGYKNVASFGRKKRERGGVMVLVAKKFKCNTKPFKTTSVEMEFESCGVDLSVMGRSIRIIGIYRPCNDENNVAEKMEQFLTNLENTVEKHLSPDRDLLILGDLNINLLVHSQQSNALLDIMNSYELKLLNKTATRVTNVSKTLIDHLFSSLVCLDTTIEKVHFSDHDAIFCTLDVELEDQKDVFKYKRDMSEQNWNEFVNAVSLETWTSVLAEENVNQMCHKFMSILIFYFEINFPMKRVVIRANQVNKVDLSVSTRECKRRLREIGESLQKTTNPVLKDRLKNVYKTQKSYLGFCINNEVRMTNTKKLNDSTCKSRTAWNIIKENAGKIATPETIETLQIEGAKVSDKKEIVNHMNRMFVEKKPDYNDLDLIVEPDAEPGLKFTLLPSSSTEICKIIEQLPSKNSVGWDGISINVLKRVRCFVSPVLSSIVNRSFESGTFPENLKLALVTPIFKKGSKCEASNYRPIAVTSAVSKILEKALLNRLDKYFGENNLLNSQQHGFRKGKSTVTALFDFVTEVFSSLEKRERVNAVLYDFSNAFGCLLPELLVKKLKCYGLDEKTLSWIYTFLTDRRQVVQLRSVDETNTEVVIQSEALASSMGVPQGTVLGPFGFTAYSNDMPLRVVLACLILFADDSTSLVKGKTYEDVNKKTVSVNQDVQEYAAQNFLRLNSSKTKILQMHTRQTRNICPPEVYINEERVEVVHTSKLLGVTISDIMSWSAHCDDVVKKLRSTTYLFVQLRGRVSDNILRQMYFAYTQSQVLYSIVIWGAPPSMDKVFVAQKRVLRAMAGKRYWKSLTPVESCRQLFKQFEILPVYSLYILECVKFVKKYPEKFTRNCDIHDYNTRNKNKLAVKPSTLKLSDLNPSVMMVKLYNHLPDQLKNVENVDLFTKCAKKLFMYYQFYTVTDYYNCKFTDEWQ